LGERALTLNLYSLTMLGDIIFWAVFGLIAGAIAKFLMPGDDPGGIFVTILIGIVGAFIGGFLGQLIFGTGGVDGFNIGSFVTAIIGALILLFVYRKVRTRT
jgi:uncharacterized membrane protein YeaQ/YmgE (transglycosylase-associated protein family)